MIEAIEITKYYGDFPAVTNISFKYHQLLVVENYHVCMFQKRILSVVGC